MRRINLNDKQQERYETIKRLCDNGLTESKSSKNRAALKLGVCPRTIDRMIKAYREKGKEAFVHGNRGRRPHNAFDPEIKQQIIELYLTEYPNANFCHFAEIVERKLGISISSQTISNWLGELNVASPLANKSTKRMMRKRDEMARKKVAKDKEQPASQTLPSSILDRRYAHPSRSACKYFGEMVQMDGSTHEWLPGLIWTLHLAVDDATGEVLGGYYDEQETLFGYYNLMKCIIEDYGIPAMLYTDNRTVFEYKKKGIDDVEKDTQTQFKAAMSYLGVEIKTTSVPQAKGKIERLNGTLQSRLPIELKDAGVETIEQANQFLRSYFKNYNKQFSHYNHTTESVFEVQPSENELYYILSVKSSRKINNGHVIQYQNKRYRPCNDSGEPILFKKGTPVTVIRPLDNSLLLLIEDQVYTAVEVPKNETVSKDFDTPVKKVKKDFVPKPPAPDHPWKHSYKNIKRSTAYPYNMV